jgi:2'-5' RNA ligase
MRRAPDGRRARNRSDALRVFFAVWPDAAARDALAALARDAAARTQGREVPVANLHLTIAFVGDVAPARVADLRAIGKAVAGTAPSFMLTLDRAGTFRGTGITWAGPSSTPPHLAQLARQLADALAAEGFAVERRAFNAHVTLARRCRKPGDVTLAAPVPWTAARLVLNASNLRTGAVAYGELDGWTLGMIPAIEYDRRGIA